jgi:transposase InsO family protein
LSINQYYNHPKTPKDNLVNERFNRILKEEFLSLGNFHPALGVFNAKLGN